MSKRALVASEDRVGENGEPEWIPDEHDVPVDRERIWIGKVRTAFILVMVQAYLEFHRFLSCCGRPSAFSTASRTKSFTI
jgi:hypothetical protein